ncbi:VanW family protein, partial [Candidatus Peregrinibacteria bacterium]|nr:VanW family protein [Candidatus Peregrinibacteria bacterium]
MKRQLKDLFIVGFFLSTIVLGIVGAIYGISTLSEETFLTRVNLPQGKFDEYQSFQELTDFILEKEETFLNSEIAFTSERGDITTTFKDMGVSMVAYESLQELHSFMESSSALKKTQAYIFGIHIKLPLSLDEDGIKAAFTESSIEQGKKNATLAYDYSSGLFVDEEQIGYGVDTSEIMKQIELHWLKDFTTPATAKLPLRTAEPDVRNDEIAALIPKLADIVEREIEFIDEAYGQTWSFHLRDHAAWILPMQAAETGFTIHPQNFFAYLGETFGPELESEAVSATVIENEDGTYDFEGSARFGQDIDEVKILADFMSAIHNEELSVMLAVKEIMPEITVPDSLSAKGITDLVGVGYSSFSGSPYNRIFNINVGMDIFNGTILAPGEEFSFTTLMGPIDGAHGWLPELVILGDETKPEYGGGLCQVSSTMFRAALYSGLDISARKNHSYAVSYYARPFGYGLDATIYDPAPDFRFINDTAGHLIIQGY